MTASLDNNATEALDSAIDDVITGAGLRRDDCVFFTKARSTETQDPAAALRLARKWAQVTQSFMFTTIAGLGVMGAKLARDRNVSREVLAAYQTAYRVIGDDLDNVADEFSAVAPRGADGIHYLWWIDTISAPVAAALNDTKGYEEWDASPACERLLDLMDRLGQHELGAAVQLRVVETIALDIAVAFRRIFGRVMVDGTPVLPHKSDFAWIDSHIKAETSHAASVSDDETGMASFAAEPRQRDEILRLTEPYVRAWREVLDDFAVDVVPAP